MENVKKKCGGGGNEKWSEMARNLNEKWGGEEENNWGGEFFLAGQHLLDV
jgi:hypothetical protein